jgi:hypothetical protein
MRLEANVVSSRLRRVKKCLRWRGYMQGCQVIRINGPDNKTVSDTRIDNWIINGRDRLDRAD